MTKLLDVEYIDQTVLWPTGCESVSTVMALRYLGLPITVDEFIAQDLECRDLHRENGVLYGPDPEKYFIGDPHTDDDGSYGCYAGAIIAALCRVNWQHPDFPWSPVNLNGEDTDAIVKKYVADGIPIIYWATMDMQPSAFYNSWILDDTGEELIWKSREHCLLLTGSDEENYIFHDPWKNNGIVSHPKRLVEERHNEMFSMAVSFRREKRNTQNEQETK